VGAGSALSDAALRRDPVSVRRNSGGDCAPRAPSITASIAPVRVRITGAARRLPKGVIPNTKENPMGKYFIAWLLGVPAVVLVVAYLFFH
jgi:hypothetical protein